MKKVRRMLLRLAWPLAKLYVRIWSRPAVRVVACSRGRVLLVRHSYGPRGWNVPGGGVSRGESLEEAAAREVREEVGLAVSRLEPLPIASEENVFLGFPASEGFRVDGVEIVEARWFALRALPADVQPRARRVVEAAAGILSA